MAAKPENRPNAPPPPDPNLPGGGASPPPAGSPDPSTGASTSPDGTAVSPPAPPNPDATPAKGKTVTTKLLTGWKNDGKVLPADTEVTLPLAQARELRQYGVIDFKDPE